jgi:Cu/Ag efflux protein CusF
MNKRILKFSLLGLLALAMTVTPVALHAQTTNAAPVAPKRPINRPLPFRGKVKSVDASAKTISVGTLTLQITSQTKIIKVGKPATLEEVAIGDDVAGSYRKDAEGNMNAVSLRIGPKMPVESNTKTNTP